MIRIQRLWSSMIIVLCLVGTTSAGEEAFVYDDQGKRDPLWPLVTARGAVMSYETEIYLSDMILEGIIMGQEGGNLAIVNGMIVKPNDRLGQYIVAQITHNSVVLSKGEENFTLRLKKEE